MNVHTQHKIRIESSRLMSSLFAWNFKAAFAWKGIEFQDFREYAPGDDAKYIDWLTSSREGTTVMRRYREERNANILAVVDLRESLNFENKQKKDLIRNILELLYSASRANWEWLGWYILSSQKDIFVPVRKNPISLEKLKQLNSPTQKNNKKLSLDCLMNQRLKRSVVFVISDSMIIDKKSLMLASHKHDIIYIYVSSHFENTLQGDGISSLRSSGLSLGVDLSDKKKKQEYVLKRSAQIWDFEKTLQKIGIDFMSVDEQDSIIKKFLDLMQQRKKY